MAQYTEEKRAQVVADVLAGMSMRQAAKAHHVALSSVYAWVQGVRTKSLEEREKLILGRYFDIIEAAADAYTDRDWLLKQDAPGAAQFVGVISDKAARLHLLIQLGEAALPERKYIDAGYRDVSDVPDGSP